MSTDLRKRQIQMPVIPKARRVQERLREVLEQAEKLKILLRVASEIEQAESQFKREDKSRG